MQTSLGDVIIESSKEFLRSLFLPVSDLIGEHGPGLIQTIVTTPRPNAVFAQPTNRAWPELYQYYWDTIIPLTLILWALSLGLVIFLESTSHLFSSYHRSKLKKRAFSGLLGILSWWWIAALSLRFMDALSKFLLPDFSTLTLFDTASFGAIGLLGLVISLSVDLVLFLVIGTIYYLRQVLIYLYVLLMPLLIVFWIPGVGPFTLVSRLMKQLAGFFVPFLFMTVPIALLFRLGELIGSSASPTLGGVGRWLVAITVPLLAVVIPFVFFWQAGAIFFMVDRAGHHVSARRARTRIADARSLSPDFSHERRNFVRGIRGKPAVRDDGQTLLGVGQSRAHSAGTRLNRAGGELQRTLLRGEGTPERSGQPTSDRSPHSRTNHFEELRNRDADPSALTDERRSSN